REIWIPARSDQLGSGTQADPYGGGKRYTPVISCAVTFVPTSDAPYAAQVAASAAVDQPPHSYVVGDLITMSGATDWAFNGAFAIESFSSSDPRTFNITLRSQPAGSAGGSPACFKTIFVFDQVMRSLPQNTIIHIGPGTFETQGCAEGVPTDK